MVPRESLIFSAVIQGLETDIAIFIYWSVCRYKSVVSVHDSLWTACLHINVGVCRTSKELNPLDDEIVIKMKAIIDTDISVIGSVIVLCYLAKTVLSGRLRATFCAWLAPSLATLQRNEWPLQWKSTQMPLEDENYSLNQTAGRQRSRLNYWIRLCPKCPPFALTHACTGMHHCVPLPECRINNALIMSTMTSHWCRHYMVKAVHFVEILPSTSHGIVSHSGLEIFVYTNYINWLSYVTES